MSGPTRTLAAFDVDGTLTARDTLAPFLARIVGRTALVRAAAANAPRLAPIALGRGDRDATKERMLVRLLRGRPYEPIATAGAAYGREIAADRVAPAMHERIAWHLEQDHEVVLVSASLGTYLDEVARVLGASTALCTRLEVDDDGHCTGRMIGGNCRGAAKADRLLAHIGRGDATIYAYGDSRGDDELLALADHAFRVRHTRGGVRCTEE
ncbi:MAG TPA: HAD-IB family hydrolase [Acidimicrobiia bacterium]|nr:HAD-IB family hydrolase [Acidimicrobiia bacterium]